MKVTVIIGIVAAALGGALLATVLGGDDDDASDAVPVERTASDGAVPAAAPAVNQPRQSSTPSRRPLRRVRYIEPDDRPIGRAELDRVRDAALGAVGGGTVTDIDRSDDLGVAYEVEVVQNGLDIDVRLDSNLNTVASGYDD